MPTYDGKHSMADHLHQIGVSTWVTTSYRKGRTNGVVAVLLVDTATGHEQRVGAYASIFPAQERAGAVALDAALASGKRVALTLYSDRAYRIVKPVIHAVRVGGKIERTATLGFDSGLESRANKLIEESYERENR